ncbi:MAG: MGH1-like glycoside hydrolase domain-containing protein [Cytophagales bacterium]
MKFTKVLKPVITNLLLLISIASFSQSPIWQNSKFTMYKDSVRQGAFVAKIQSAIAINSNYKSPTAANLSPYIIFRFSINGKDNEMKQGADHLFAVNSKNGICETPNIKFGVQYKDTTKLPENTYLKPGTQLKIKLDMRGVFDDFKTKGFYIAANGDKIFKEDFKALYVAGGTSPMLWNFDNVQYHPELLLKDYDDDGIYEVTLKLGEEKEQKQIASVWKLIKDISRQPIFKSDFLISDAIYNLAIEEMLNAIEPDSTFRTGKEWAGVWTRDISYSIILSMAYLQPKVAMYSLLKKVKNDRIVQDTGTGGAYPASTDRIVWAIAAWEVYKATGDKAWLKKIYTIIKNSINDDVKNAYDIETGLVKGESSFLDWREQTYPKWMQPADIFESECLGTNALHFQANIVGAKIATAMGDQKLADTYNIFAKKIKEGINKYLWLPEKGYYAQYLYGKNYKIASPRAEALGEALAILFGVADSTRQDIMMKNMPVTSFGIPCIYPQISNIPAYHNNAVWPFVEAYWAMAAAKVGNESSVIKSIAAIYRPAALFLTNKENFVSTNGDFAGTVINSSNMLWCLSGNIALVHKILFGIEFESDKLTFHPFIPEKFKGNRQLYNFKYRQSTLNIQIEGFGNHIKSFMIDGKPAKPFVNEDIEGVHSIKIVMSNTTNNQNSINEAADIFTPETPLVVYADNAISWNSIAGAKKYKILVNGKEMNAVFDTKLHIFDTKVAEYQVVAVDAQGYESFASEPVLVAKDAKMVEAELNISKSNLVYKGFTGNGFVEISKTQNQKIAIPISIAEDGFYALDFRYANGNGPTNTENKCAMRTLKIDNLGLGTIIFPQRGTNEWSNWGYSNIAKVSLKKGDHLLSLSFESWNENMNGEINQAMIDHLRIVKLK